MCQVLSGLISKIKDKTVLKNMPMLSHFIQPQLIIPQFTVCFISAFYALTEGIFFDSVRTWSLCQEKHVLLQ